MKTKFKHLFIALAMLATFNLQPATANAQTTTFMYQGRLNDGGMPANGSYDLQFALFDGETNGNQVGDALTNSAVNVSNGLFTVALDFGGMPFDGSARWLEIGVQTNGGAGFVTLVPRQPVLPVPYAIEAGSAGSVSATNINGAISDTQLSTNVALLNGDAAFSGTVAATNFGGSGAGLTNVPGAFLWQVISGTNQQAASNAGYLATNDSQVTVTLPASPNTGDVIGVSGSGLGGWKIAQNTGQYGPDQFGQVIKSSSGFLSYTTWTNHVNNFNPYSVAASADGTKLVAGGGGPIYTSTDSGLTWTLRTNIAAGYYVASSTDGTKLVAVGIGSIATSTDSGATWVPQSPGVGGNWDAVASSADGTKLVALLSSGQIYTSPDSGVSWIPRTAGASLSSVAMSEDGTKLVAGANNQIYISTNSGVAWTFRTNVNSGATSVASSSDGTKLVAATLFGPVYISTDSGATWMAQNSGSRTWGAVASSSDGTRLVAAVGRNGGASGLIYTSLDSGVTWVAQNSGIRSWISIASSADGTRLAAAGSGGAGGPGIYTSQLTSISKTTPGTSGNLLGGQNAAVELQYIGNGQFILINHEGMLFGF